MTGPTGTSSEVPPPDARARPSTRIVTVHRAGWIRAGGLAIAVGALLLVTSAVTLGGQQATQLAAAKGRARVGNPITFTSKAADHRITFLPDPLDSGFAEERVAQLDCEVTDPDGSTRSLDVASSSVRITSRAGVTASTFRAKAGSTAVRCAWGGASDLGGSYSVARTRKGVQTFGLAALAVGIVAVLGGGGALAVGFRGRPERRPIET